MRTVMWKSKKFPLSALATAVVLTALTGCSENQDAGRGAMPPPSVSVVAVEMEPVGAYQEFSARTEASETVDLRARVEGYLQKRNFLEGESVNEGQLLFSIDPAPFEASLSQAKASVSSAEAELIRANADLKRGRELASKGGFISQSDLDNLKTKAAQANAAMEVAKAQLKTANINLSYTKIFAPFSGQIGKETYSIGNLVGPSSEPLAELIKTNPMYVNFQINEKTLLDYHQAQSSGAPEQTFTTQIRLPNGTLYSEPGTFDFADVKVEETTGTVDMRTTFPNPKELLLPGMYVTLIVESEHKTEMPLIPQFSVQENMQGRFVLVVTAENKVETRLVELGRRIGPMWVVKSGLNAGEKIIVSGLQKVRPGVVVNPQLMDVDTKTGTLTAVASAASAPDSSKKGAQ
ncbi:efflux RND transporter periplasmic adaptor subunit [Parendozoicomonas haliclonae]|uniref:Efflux pump periplasmic linker BepF n=1 Tax=Parendozoicomonas haliclonae TaxID=1960125 RepID=A0A1X7AHZ0_9GAMM|nr:efflux RND transporter periplasmic adaptor subunit [Parendozoicomonas haliclonae]SMA43875.1 Efflux pump periplasmic linker BepF [Parendozoicomonas haliclonae]